MNHRQILEKLKYFSLRIEVFLAVFWLLVCQVSFYFVQESQSQKIVDNLKSQLRQELDFSNFDYLARSIADYTTQGSIRCSVVKRVSQPRANIIDLRYLSDRCTNSPYFLHGAKVDVLLRSLNGEIFQFQFRVNHDGFFIFSLWLVRLLGIGLIVMLYFFRQQQIAKSRSEYDLKLSMMSAFQDLARQVAHDIRSPIMALNALHSSVDELPEEKRLLLKNAIDRANYIASELIRKSKAMQLSDQANKNLQTVSSDEFVAAIESLVKEKKLEQESSVHTAEIITAHEIKIPTVHCMDLHLLKRVLSNVLNNSFESFQRGVGNLVMITTNLANRNLVLAISDNGKGMDAETLKRVGQRNMSFGKTGSGISGSGLGLAHAMETVKSIGGTLEIQSQPQQGTTITIRIPQLG
jgi:signal transduction histidine kinase